MRRNGNLRKMKNNWSESLSRDEIHTLTCGGRFEIPFMPSYSKLVLIKEDHYEGRVGYGNGTEHHVTVTIDKGDWEGALYLVVNGKRGKFSYIEAKTIGIPWISIKERLKLNFPWDAHMLSLFVKMILNRIEIGLPTHWERPKEFISGL